MREFIQHTEPLQDKSSDRVREFQSGLSSDGEKQVPYYGKKTIVADGEILRQYGYEEDMEGQKGDPGGLFGL